MSYLGRENVVQEFDDFDDSDVSSSESEADFLDEDAIQQSNIYLYIIVYLFPIFIL